MKILLVEDDRATRTLLEKALAAHYTVETAADGLSALALAEQIEYDLLLLDIGIPDPDGISVCHQLRAEGYQAPILLLTAHNEAGDRVLGLDAGADDYMVKPVHIPELLARIRALLRRGSTTQPTTIIWGNLHLDCLTNEIRYQDQVLRLTRKEYGILELLLLNPQRIFSRSAMLDRLWELGDPPTENAISSHIKAIRQKLKAAGASQDLIETMYGFGYRLGAPETTQPLEPQTGLHPTVLHPTNQVTVSDRASEITPNPFSTVMAELWERFQDSFYSELNRLDQVIVALSQGTLTADMQQTAKQIAHKLVGSLGVYGFPQGSVLAKQIEDLLHPDISLGTVEIEQMAEMVKVLRQMLSQRSQSAVAPTSEPQSPRVLVVDDDPALTDRLQADAMAQSLQMTIAANPVIAQSLLGDTLPDVVLLDLTFPESNEAGLTWLKQLQQQHPTIPVLVFTGRDSLSDRLAVSRLGVRQFLHKPATTAQIFQAIARALSPSTTAAAKVLIVDDDPGMLTLLKAMLTPWGVLVSTLGDPQRFWEVLVNTTPDLVLLDLEMPAISGLELCQVVRQDAHWGDLPILVVTAHTDATSLQQAFAAGADDFITKPVLGPELVTRVLSRIERTRQHQLAKPPDRRSQEET